MRRAIGVRAALLAATVAVLVVAGSALPGTAPPTDTTYPLTVTVTGAGVGTVLSTPIGIACPTNCRQSWARGTVIRLVAQPSANSTFTGWSGACIGTGSCEITLNAATEVGASFAPSTSGGSGGAPPDTTVDAVLKGVSVTRSSAGVRNVRADVVAGELISVDLELRRSGVSLARKHVVNVPPGRRTVALKVPGAVKAGRVVLLVTFQDPRDNDVVLRRVVVLPSG